MNLSNLRFIARSQWRYILLYLVLMQSQLIFPQFYPAKVYNIQDGLPSNSVYDIEQTHDGRLWFLTSKGVASYNSLQWKLLPDSLGLPNSIISRMETTADGALWVAGDNDSVFVIKYMLEDIWYNVDVPEEILHSVHAFAFDAEFSDSGYMLALSNTNQCYVYTSASDKWEMIGNPEGKPTINSLTLYHGVLYIGTSAGLYIYDKGFRPSEVNEQIGGDKEILKTTWANGTHYFLGKGWVGTNNEKGFQIITKSAGITSNSLHLKHNLEVDGLGRVFYSSQTPVYYLDGNTDEGKVLYVDGRYSHTMSLCVLLDRENNLWVGDYRGLFKFNLLRFQNFNKYSGLKEDEVSAIAQGKDGRLILANPTSINFFQDDKITEAKTLSEAPGTRISDIAEDDKGNIYLSALNNGLWKFDGKKAVEVKLPDIPADGLVTSVNWFKGQLYVGTFYGLYTGMPGNFTFHPEVKGVRNLVPLGEDTLVACTMSEGVYFLDGNGGIKQCKSSKRKYNSVFSAMRWKGNLLLATGSGVAVLRNDAIIKMTEIPDFGRVASYCFLKDTRGQLWIGTNEGVFIWDGEVLVNYNESHGLSGNEVNRNALVQLPNGDIWIGTGSGASRYNALDDLSYKAKPILRFEKITSQNGREVEEGATLPYNDNTISFAFLGVSFIDEARIRYRYRLNGFDRDWIYVDRQDVGNVRYTNLPTGEYNFEVQAGVGNTNWGAPLYTSFVIEPPYYTKAWFIALVSLITLTVIYGLYRVRFYMVLKQRETLKYLVRERTNEIWQKNNEIAAQNQALKTQSEKIVAINGKLEQMVFERTRQLERQNKKLLQYAFLNSHKLRGPICTILGLMDLLKITKMEEQKEIVGMIKDTAVELDAITREIDQIWDDMEVKQ